MSGFSIVVYIIAAVFAVMTVPPLLHIIALVRLGRREGWDAVARLSPNYRERDPH